MDQRKLFAVGAVIGGVVVARRLLSSKGRPIMERMMERLPPDSPPKLVMAILPRLQEQNDAIIALLREQNELLRQGQPEAVTR